MNSYLEVKTVGEMERQLAVHEVISAFHTAAHTHSSLHQCSVPQLQLKLFSTNHTLIDKNQGNYHKSFSTICKEKSAE
jgi:hypothetical protein